MWEIVLFLAVNNDSGSLSLDSAVHRIIAHVRRWVVFLAQLILFIIQSHQCVSQ